MAPTLEEKYNAFQKAINDGSKGGASANVQKYEVLWNVDKVITSTPKNDVAASGMQSKFFKQTIIAINQGCSSSVSRVMAVIICKLVDVTGDTKQLINHLREIHNIILGKTSAAAKNSAMEVLGMVSEKKGISVASLFVDTANILFKQIKSGELGTRTSAFKALKGAVEGAGVSGSSLHEEILKTAKSCAGDKAPEVRISAIRCVASVAKCATYIEVLEKAVSFSVKLLEDEVAAVRLEAANCLGFTLVQAFNTRPSPNGAHGQRGGMASVVGGAAPLRRLPTTWDMESILGFLSELFTRGTKREFRAAISRAFVRFLNDSTTQNVEKFLDLIVTNALRLLLPTSSKLAPTEALQALNCVSNILREGLSQKLSETGQQNVIKALCKHLAAGSGAANSDNYELLQLAAMREISAQLLELGEGGLSMSETLTNTIMAQLTDRSPPVRLAAATCLRALSTALPKYTANLLSQCLRNLTVIFADFDPTQPDSLRGSLSSLKGNAHAAAALISSVRSSELGVPVSLLNYVMQTATSLLGSLDMSAAAMTLVRVECGWALIDALILTMGTEFVEPILPTLLNFWKATFSIGGPQVASEREIAIFCRSRADGLASISSFAACCPTLMTQKVLAQLLPYLTATLQTTLTLPSGGSHLQPTTLEVMRLLELNLLKAYCALPPNSYAPSHASLLRMVASLMLDGPQNSILRGTLHEDDAPLGPWEKGDEGVLENLNEPLTLPSQDASVIWSRDYKLAIANQQPTDVRVVDAAIRVFVLLFVSLNEKHRMQLLTHMTNAIKDCNNATQRLVMQTNSLCSMLLVTKMVTEKRLSIGKGDALSTMQKFIQRFIGDSSAALRRAAGEALGYLCNSEGDVLTSSLVRNITDLIKKPSKDVVPAARAGAAFVLACIQRSVGGMMAQRHFTTTVGSLHVLAQDPLPSVSTWALHALCITINEAVSSFSSFATPTLLLVGTLLQNEAFLNSPTSYQSLGRLVNAIIGALGPELVPGGQIMLLCEAVCAEMEAHPHPLVKLESIYFKQKLVLFAPHATDLVLFLPFMVSQFSSPYLSLRSAAVTCLKQLVQASQGAAKQAIQLNEALFRMLDREKDVSLRGELQVLISTLLDMAAPAAPLPWLTLCKTVVLSASARQEGPSNPEPAAGQQEEDEEVQSAVSAPAASEKQDVYVYRWYTKVFAMECVRRVISGVKGQPEHFDLILARQKIAMQPQLVQDFLVFHLHDLVTMAFKAATSDTDSIRPVGIWTLKDIVEGFSAAVDPDYEGHSLLELYQAQIASALRPAFASDALPSLTAVACSVLVTYITVANSLETSAVRKLLTLLTIPLVELREMSYPSYNEKSITLVQVAILSALAQIHLATIDPKSPENLRKIGPLLAPSHHLLRVHWLAFLRDFAFLTTPAVPPDFYKAIFHNYSLKAIVGEYYHKNFTTILQAASSLIANPCWFDGRDKDVPEQNTNIPLSDAPTPASNYTPEVKEMLRETKGIQDWYVMFGLTLKLLMLTTVPGRVPIALKVFKYLMNENYLRSALFGLDVFKEFLQVLTKIVDTEDVEVRSDVASLLLFLVDNFEPKYFDSGLAESAFHDMLALILLPLHKYLRIGSKDKNPAQQPAPVVTVVNTSLTSIAHLPRLFSAQLRNAYGPIVMFVLVQTIDICHTQEDNMFPVVLQALTGLAKTQQDDPTATPEWEHVVFSAVSALLRSVSSKLSGDVDQNFKNIHNSIFALMSLVMSLQAQPKHHHPEAFQTLHDEVVALLLTVYDKPNTKLRQLAVQLIRTMVQAAAASPSTPSLAFKYLQDIAPRVSIRIYKSQGVPGSPDEELLVNEEVKLLTFTHTLAPDDFKPKMLHVLIPCLVHLLQPQLHPAVPPIHTITLQLITHFASTSAQDFKDAMSSLPPEDKQTLQTSVQQTVAAANASAAKAAAAQQQQTAAAAPRPALKLDFSKYGK